MHINNSVSVWQLKVMEEVLIFKLDNLMTFKIKFKKYSIEI